MVASNGILWCSHVGFYCFLYLEIIVYIQGCIVFGFSFHSTPMRAKTIFMRIDVQIMNCNNQTNGIRNYRKRNQRQNKKQGRWKPLPTAEESRAGTAQPEERHKLQPHGRIASAFFSPRYLNQGTWNFLPTNLPPNPHTCWPVT